MGRRKLSTAEQRQTVSIRIPNDLLVYLNEIKNKSKFFEWLLQEYFNTIK